MALIPTGTRTASVLISIATVGVVLVTAHHPDQADLLSRVTRENGIVEWSSVAVLILIGLTSIRALLLDRRQPALSSLARGVLAALLVAAVIAALEEISWGQQVLGFPSSKFFLDHNLQRETNLHNLVPASISSSIINTAIYIFFLWLPCILRIAPASRLAKAIRSRQLEMFLPSLDTMFIFAFGSTLQAYFRPPTWTDTLALIVTLILLGIMLSRTSRIRPQDWLLFTWVLLCAILFASHYGVFRFANMQYEIRELIIVLGCLHWITDWAIPSSESTPNERAPSRRSRQADSSAGN